MALAAGALAQSAPRPADETLKLNQIQVVGTHNSYALPADPRVMAMMAPRIRAQFAQPPANLSPEQRVALADEHPGGLADPMDAFGYIQMPLEAQLASGVRSVELDLQPDPKGGLYADPAPYRALAARGEKDLKTIDRDALREPGLKVFHVADLDFRSQCPTFRSCLTLLRQWSDATPGHSPVFVLLEPKLSGAGEHSVAPFDADAFAEVDRSIAEIIGRDRVVTPDDVRGTMPTLEAAVLAKRWPTLAQARGKFLFLFLVPGMNFAAFAPYLDGHRSLEGRMAFVQGKPGMAHTAFLLFDNALTRQADIRAAVAKGYLVRTRADIDTADARRNDPARREAALASGAQIVSTDYLTTPNVHGTDYHLAPFAGGWRCDAVTSPCPVSR
ncbi:Ca2+-dependent phosphoinositide-specific phospholipase C [uncultured Sphingomonas sp.]|uniref:Ca2+-dependent phosphoinositide-specific phospholipase C n=1 Tax=uncultured Sphingomonas sp. TaxID=158754 RepID=UPI0025F7136E|nr:Ca2+-dependent phosphoinositide-specific phospholipase C [uncultured Sphingomonas sp.]